MDECHSFGEWVRRRRRSLDLTQDEVAARVGCSKVLISKIETDARRPSREVAALLAAALELAPADHPAFIQAARADLAISRLARPAVASLPIPLAQGDSAEAPPAPVGSAPDQPDQATPLPDPLIPARSQSAPAELPEGRPAAEKAAWGLWLLWIAAGAVGVGLGRLLGWLGGRLIYRSQVIDLGDGAWIFGAGLAVAGDSMLIGAVIAIMQAVVLRRRIAHPVWWGLGIALVWVMFGMISRIVLNGFGGVLIGLATGVAQWLLLRRSQRATWWLVANIIAWAPFWLINTALNVLIYSAIGGTMSQGAYNRGVGWAITLLLAGSLTGGLWGLVTGVVLGRVLQPAGGDGATALPHHHPNH